MIKRVGTWVTDKKGIDTSNEIIKPMLEHIEQQLIAYNDKHPTPEEIQKFGQIIMEHVEVSHKIIAKLRDGQLETAVLRFCAPHFSINKTKEVIKIVKDVPKKIKLEKVKHEPKLIAKPVLVNNVPEEKEVAVKPKKNPTAKKITIKPKKNIKRNLKKKINDDLSETGLV
jgi:hypothetical protein